jgi:hypothetical protein
MLDGAGSQDDRMALRRARRWHRRARIAAPFLAVPVMLGALLLSVDLIEYQPSADAERPKAPQRTAVHAPPASDLDAIEFAPDSALSVSVVESPLPVEDSPWAPAPAADGLAAWPGDLSSTARP